MITNEMKLSKEQIAKVFALYLGCEIYVGDGRTATLVSAGLDEFNSIEHSTGSYGQHSYHGEEKLILTPLSEITDEDCIEVAKIIIDKPTTSHYNITRNNTTIWNGHNAVHIMPDGELIWSNTFVDVKLSTVKELWVADFLRSKGYALPYMGIDLFESGIAIPNNKMK